MNWPVVVEDRPFVRIPDSWIGGGDDHGPERGRPRVYATSVSYHRAGHLVVRYLHPTQPHVLEQVCEATETPGGIIPAALAHIDRSWPRSLVVPDDTGPDGMARTPEIEHLRALWQERVEDIRGPDRVLADGGRAVGALTDLCQTHLGEGGGRR